MRNRDREKLRVRKPWKEPANRSLGLGEFVEEQGMLTSTELSLCAGLCANCFACIFHVIVTINFMSY